MIKKLDNPYILDDCGCGGPTLADIIDKLNELVEAVNRMEKQIEKLQVL